MLNKAKRQGNRKQILKNSAIIIMKMAHQCGFELSSFSYQMNKLKKQRGLPFAQIKFQRKFLIWDLA